MTRATYEGDSDLAIYSVKPNEYALLIEREGALVDRTMSELRETFGNLHQNVRVEFDYEPSEDETESGTIRVRDINGPLTLDRRKSREWEVGAVMYYNLRQELRNLRGERSAAQAA